MFRLQASCSASLTVAISCSVMSSDIVAWLANQDDEQTRSLLKHWQQVENGCNQTTDARQLASKYGIRLRFGDWGNEQQKQRWVMSGRDVAKGHT